MKKNSLFRIIVFITIVLLSWYNCEVSVSSSMQSPIVSISTLSMTDEERKEVIEEIEKCIDSTRKYVEEVENQLSRFYQFYQIDNDRITDCRNLLSEMEKFIAEYEAIVSACGSVPNELEEFKDLYEETTRQMEKLKRYILQLERNKMMKEMIIEMIEQVELLKREVDSLTNIDFESASDEELNSLLEKCKKISDMKYKLEYHYERFLGLIPGDPIDSRFEANLESLEEELERGQKHMEDYERNLEDELDWLIDECNEKGLWTEDVSSKISDKSLEEILQSIEFLRIVLSRALADVNGDGSVDVADISAVIRFMAESVEGDVNAFDVNNDGAVDVADISSIILRMAELSRLRR